MTLSEINDIRDRSESYKAFKAGKTKSCIWESDFGEMARKTVIKRIYKHLPKTEQSTQIEEAIDIDNQNNGFKQLASLSHKIYAHDMINNSMIEEEKERAYYRQKLDALETTQEVSEFIEEMEQRMPPVDPSSMGQKQLSKHLEKTI